MRIASFDVFDTLLTRVHARPEDLFVELGDELRWLGLVACAGAEFAALRIAAQADARKLAPAGEPNWDEIYQQLAIRCSWDTDAVCRAQAAELALEDRSLRPVDGMAGEVARARQTADHVLFLSDMYLPGQFIQELLRRRGIWRPGDRLLVSGEERCSKASGAMFQRMRANWSGPVEWSHWGDNRIADATVPQQFGIQPVAVVKTHLNRYESLVRGPADSVPVWVSKLAGGMRLARLCNPESNGARAVIWDTACGVVGPLWFGFVRWCLEEAQARGLRRLYFVARDGELLVELARELVKAWGLDLECRYLHGSRQAWHPAAFQNFTAGEFGWLFAPTRFLSVRQVFARLGLEPQTVGPWLAGGELDKVDWDEPLTSDLQSRLQNVLLHEPVRQAIEAESSRRRSRLTDYLQQEGIFDAVPFAVVDVGWRGNLLRSLSRVVALAGRPTPHPLTGLYFGLASDVSSTATDVTLLGYWNKHAPEDQPIEQENVVLLELFASATHGSVIGYAENGSRMVPVLDRPHHDAALQWGLTALQQGALEFARRFAAEVRLEAVATGDFHRTVWKAYREFYDRPTAEEARVWCRLPFSDQQIETKWEILAPEWNRRELLAALLDHRLRPAGWWPEAALARQPSWLLAAFLALRKARRRFQR